MKVVEWRGRRITLNDEEEEFMRSLYAAMKEGEITEEECEAQGRTLLDFKVYLDAEMIP